MVVLNRIYTRTGDDVTTALGTGARREYDAWSGRRLGKLAPDQEADVLLRRGAKQRKCGAEQRMLHAIFSVDLS